MATDTNVTHLVVNKMTQEQYDSATKNPNELYLTPETITQSDWNQTDISAADYIKNKPTIPTKTSDLTNDSDFITSSSVDSKITVETAARQQADNTLTQSIATESQNRQTADSGLQSGIDTINGKIPTQATISNQLADKNFVNSSINSVTAYYITRNAAGDQFNTKAQLDSTTTFYSGGEVRVPTRNDYCIVLADETKTDPVTGENPTTRYIYQVNGWEFQYIVNKTSLTAAQLAAVNSGITAAAVTKLGGIAEGAEVNVQSDWSQTNTSADDYIKNKPSNLVSDANYVHTDNNFTTTEKNKLSGISAGAEVNVQSDWNQTSGTSDAYIKNKPTLGSLASLNSVGTSQISNNAVTSTKIDWSTITSPLSFSRQDFGNSDYVDNRNDGWSGLTASGGSVTGACQVYNGDWAKDAMGSGVKLTNSFVSGYYLVSTNVVGYSLWADDYVAIRLMKNNSDVSLEFGYSRRGGCGNSSDIVYLKAGDILNFQTYTSNTGHHLNFRIWIKGYFLHP